MTQHLISLPEYRRLRTARIGRADGPPVAVVLVVADDAEAERLQPLLERILGTPLDSPPALEPPAPDPSKAPPDRPTSLTVGDVEMDLHAVKVRVDNGGPIGLTNREFRLLRTFLEHSGRVLSRRQLMLQAWDDPAVGDGRTVDVHVRRLRVKLADSRTRIVTVRGFGYRLDAE